MNDVNNSPTSSCSDDSDAVNTSTAKVYFGPLLSPEKKYAPLLSPCVARPPKFEQSSNPFPFPLRRSPRLSPVQLPDDVPMEDIEEEQKEEQKLQEDSDEGVENEGGEDQPLSNLLRTDGESYFFLRTEFAL